ncbi:MAG: co-chaperone GroES [Clostridia bacterium]|nr:co-chaperone GroES [Clostridia bacterium]
MTLKPLADNVVIKLIEAEQTTKSGIVLTSASKEKPQIAEVVAVGPGGIVDGKEVSTGSIKVGQKVVAAKYSGTDIKIGDEEYTILHISDILAIVE